MFTINVEFDGGEFDRSVAAYDREVLGPALIDAVNDAAEAARERLVEAMSDVFDRPTPFTLSGIGVLPARAGGDRDPAALVSVLPLQAEYLGLEVHGGVRVAGDHATTNLGPLVPGPAAPLDGYGNLPRGYVAQALQDPAVAWVHLTPDEPPALVRRQGDRLDVLAFIVREAHYEAPRLPFYDLVTEAVAKSLPEAFARRLGA